MAAMATPRHLLRHINGHKYFYGPILPPDNIARSLRLLSCDIMSHNIITGGAKSHRGRSARGSARGSATGTGTGTGGNNHVKIVAIFVNHASHQAEILNIEKKDLIPGPDSQPGTDTSYYLFNLKLSKVLPIHSDRSKFTLVTGTEGSKALLPDELVKVFLDNLNSRENELPNAKAIVDLMNEASSESRDLLMKSVIENIKDNSKRGKIDPKSVFPAWATVVSKGLREITAILLQLIQHIHYSQVSTMPLTKICSVDLADEDFSPNDRSSKGLLYGVSKQQIDMVAFNISFVIDVHVGNDTYRIRLYLHRPTLSVNLQASGITASQVCYYLADVIDYTRTLPFFVYLRSLLPDDFPLSAQQLFDAFLNDLSESIMVDGGCAGINVQDPKGHRTSFYYHGYEHEHDHDNSSHHSSKKMKKDRTVILFAEPNSFYNGEESSKIIAKIPLPDGYPLVDYSKHADAVGMVLDARDDGHASLLAAAAAAGNPPPIGYDPVPHDASQRPFSVSSHSENDDLTSPSPDSLDSPKDSSPVQPIVLPPPPQPAKRGRSSPSKKRSLQPDSGSGSDSDSGSGSDVSAKILDALDVHQNKAENLLVDLPAIKTKDELYNAKKMLEKASRSINKDRISSLANKSFEMTVKSGDKTTAFGRITGILGTLRSYLDNIKNVTHRFPGFSSIFSGGAGSNKIKTLKRGKGFSKYSRVGLRGRGGGRGGGRGRTTARFITKRRNTRKFTYL